MMDLSESINLGKDDMDTAAPKLGCVAEQKSTNIAFAGASGPQSARTGQWSRDGTCIISTTPDNAIETIVLYV